MKDGAPECPYCEKEMERGFLLDFTRNAVINSRWQAGDPQDQKFFGLKTGGVKLNKKRTLPVSSYRCSDCGYLESYAPSAE